MDNLPSDQNNQNSPPENSGEIFGGQNESGYDQATQLPQEQSSLQQENTDQQQDYSAAQPYGQPATGETGQPGSDTGYDGGNVPPPSFVEHKSRSVFVLIFAVILLVLFLFGIYTFFIKGRSKKPQTPPQITLTYWGVWEDESVVKGVFDDYQRQHSNITIKYSKQDQKQYRERLQATIDRGEGPDIFRFHNTWFPMMINSLAPVPKTIYSDADFKTKFYPVVSEDLSAGGNYYGIPLQIDGLLLFYNEDILKSANVAVPKTWLDMQNAAAKLTVKENDRIVTSGVALGTAENIEHFSDILTLMMLQNGTQPLKSLFTCADPSSTTCATEALSFYHKFAEIPQNSWDDTLENSILAFAGGKVAFVFAPSWQAFTIKAIKPELNFKTALVPQLPCDKEPCPSVHLASYWVEGVSAKSKNQQAAFELLHYLSTPEVLQKIYADESKIRLFGEPYPLVELGKLLSENQYVSSVITAAPNMKSFYSVSRTYDGETGINSGLNTYLKDAVNSLSQGGSSETALKTADSGFKQVFSRFGLAPAQ